MINVLEFKKKCHEYLVLVIQDKELLKDIIVILNKKSGFYSISHAITDSLIQNKQAKDTLSKGNDNLLLNWNKNLTNMGLISYSAGLSALPFTTLTQQGL